MTEGANEKGFMIMEENPSSRPSGEPTGDAEMDTPDEIHTWHEKVVLDLR